MSSKQFAAQINKRVRSTEWCIFLVTNWNRLHGYGGRNEILSSDQVARYNADPDLFAATFFGFLTIDQYREWIRSGNSALCGERTKTGNLCGNSTGKTYRPEVWRERHRSQPCWMHGGRR